MTSDRPAAPLLTVKQVIPPVRAGAVPRSRPVSPLRDAATRLTVVVAPPGWGKTSLLGSWASDPGGRDRVAWVSLDEGDDEPTRFWSYLLTALRRVGDEISPASLDALAAPGGDPVDLALLQLTVRGPVARSVVAAMRTRFDVASTPAADRTVLTVDDADQAAVRALMLMLWDSGHEVLAMSTEGTGPS